MTYRSNRGRWNVLVKDLEKHYIYVNMKDSVTLNFPNVFEKYPFEDHNTNSVEWKRWANPDEYMRNWQSQLSFAVHCSTTALGISAQYLNDKSIPIITSIFRFHAYYHIRRILFRMGVPLPYENGFNRYNNNFSLGGFSQICDEYNVDSKALYKFESSTDSWDQKSHSFWKTTNDDYAKWIIPTSSALTSQGLIKLSESIRLYARLLLGSQLQGRASILGSDASNFTIHQLYKQELEKVIKRREHIQNDINEFQKLLQYAITPVNLVVHPKCYMIPSNMLILVGKIRNYTNNILIAPGESKTGEITSLNTPQKTKDPFHGKRTHSILPTTPSSPILPTTQLPLHDSNKAKEHDEEKQALIIGGVSLIMLGLYFLRPSVK